MREIEALKQSTKGLETYLKWLTELDVSKVSPSELDHIMVERAEILDRASKGEDFDDIIRRRLRQIGAE